MATIAIGISPKAGGGYTAKVPSNALAEDGVPPEEGDSIQASIEGKVQSVSGGTATISIDSINGEPVSEEAAESPEEEAGEEQGESAAGAGGGGGGAGGKTPVAASGPGLGRAKIGGSLPGETLAGMGARLRRGAKGRPLPF